MQFPMTIRDYFKLKYDILPNDTFDYFVNDSVIVLHAQKKRSVYIIDIHAFFKVNSLITANTFKEEPMILHESIITALNH